MILIQCLKSFTGKFFNIGKVEIPGIRTDEQLNSVLENILIYLRLIVCPEPDYNGSCDTVLINLISAGFFINEKLFDILTKTTIFNVFMILVHIQYTM